MSSNLRIISPSGAAYRHPSGVWGPRAGQWLPFGTGANGDVIALCNYNSGLVAGGAFTTIGGVTVRGLGFWNGSSWSSIGGVDNVGGDITAMAVHGGNLYVSGNFTSIAGVSASRIAMYDGSWHALGTGLNAPANSLYSFGGVLYVGGTFTVAGGVGVLFIASWNGSTWSDASTGNTFAPINAFTTQSATLVSCGGTLGNPGGVQTLGGGSWSSIGDDAGNGGIYDVEVFGGNLYGSGGGSIIDSVSFNGLVRRVSGTWEAVGTTNNIVRVMALWDSRLALAGSFTTPANRVATYNGSTISALGAGFNEQVFALTVFNGFLVAGGRFTESDGNTRNRIAYWSVPE